MHHSLRTTSPSHQKAKQKNMIAQSVRWRLKHSKSQLIQMDNYTITIYTCLFCHKWKVTLHIQSIGLNKDFVYSVGPQLTTSLPRNLHKNELWRGRIRCHTVLYVEDGFVHIHWVYALHWIVLSLLSFVCMLWILILSVYQRR